MINTTQALESRQRRTALGPLLAAAGLDVSLQASALVHLVATPEAPGECACVILDARLPGTNGTELHEALARCHGTSSFIVLDASMSREALAGEVHAAIARAGAARRVHLETVVIRTRFALLTKREREVFTLVVAGRLNKQIAADLGVTERTVKCHRASAMGKLGAHSAVDLVKVDVMLREASGQDAPSL
jgi:FixJ family two-component response regulator